VIGAGGLGSAALAHLAAAGVGELAVIDDDVVERSNLARQLLHGESDVGRAKVDSAADRLAEINPHVRLRLTRRRLSQGDAAELLTGYDVVVDASDSFETRQVVSDACTDLGVPHVWAAVSGFSGQLSVWWAGRGPCYRCVFPTVPPPGSAPSCAEGGVLGVLPGLLGTAQAAEALKIVTGIGSPLVGRLLAHDLWAQEWQSLSVRRDPGCPSCRDVPDPGLAPAPGLPRAADADDVPLVGVAEVAGLLREGAVVLVDVREPEEHQAEAIPGAVSVPLTRLRLGRAADLVDPDARLVLCCATGARSAQAAQLLLAAGWAQVASLAGGVEAWRRQGRPVRPGG
jgi:adenylyltransferase/sulfurtransferase